VPDGLLQYLLSLHKVVGECSQIWRVPLGIAGQVCRTCTAGCRLQVQSLPWEGPAVKGRDKEGKSGAVPEWQVSVEFARLK